MFSIVTVASSTRMPTASAKPPKVITLIVSPSAEDRDRAQNRQRYRNRDDERRAPAAQEQQDHQSGQHRRDETLADDARHRRIHETRLISNGDETQSLRQPGFYLRQQRLNAVDDVERRRRTRFLDRHQHGRAAVDAHDIGLRRAAVMHEGHVANIGDRPVDFLDRQIVQFRDLLGRDVQGDDIFEHADLLRADRRDEFCRASASPTSCADRL